MAEWIVGCGRGKKRRKAGGRKSNKQCWTFASGPGSDSSSDKTETPVLPAAAKHGTVLDTLRNRTLDTERLQIHDITH